MTALKINHHAQTSHYRPRVEPIKYIVIHCSAPSPAKQLEILDELGLSTHYIISANGLLTELLPPEKVAYHAGKSRWHNSTGESLNGSSIGIEIENSSLGQEKGSYSAACMKKLYALLRYLCEKYDIRPENIVGHSDISPTRKPDPGAAFPWQRLHRQNLIPWYDLRRLTAETDEKRLLQIIGYDTTDLAAARYAFCRRFMPWEVAVEPDIQKLLDTPYPKDFTPKKPTRYRQILRAAANAYQTARAVAQPSTSPIKKAGKFPAEKKL